MKNDIGLKNISNKLGVSITCVSRAIKDYPDITYDTKINILKEVDLSGYIPLDVRKAIQNRKKKFIGVIVDSMISPFFGMIIEKMITAFKGYGYNILISPVFTPIANKDAINELIYSNVDAVISFTLIDDLAYLRASIFRLPMVLFGRRQEYQNFSNIYMDDFGGGQIAANYLIKEKGAKKLLYIGNNSIECNQRRFEGFKSRATSLGISDVKYIECVCDLDEIINSVEQGYTNIFCFDDSLASRVKKLLYKNLNVIGFNGVAGVYDSFDVFPTITADYDKMVEDTCKLLIQQIEEKTSRTRKEFVYKTELRKEK